jgi:hypothetical protein
MHGDITNYNTATGSLTVAVSLVNGGGTYSAWTVSLSAPVNTQTTGRLSDGTVITLW